VIHVASAAHLECGDQNRRFNFAWNAAREARRIRYLDTYASECD
jgi:hypothetical protein